MTDQIKRVREWPSRLHAYINWIKARPYDEALNNCGTFPAGAVKAQTGVDYAAEYTRGLKTMRGQIMRMRKAGFKNHVELAASLLEEIHPSQAKIGDLAAFETDDEIGVALGVVNGERTFVLRPDGLGTLLTLDAKRAFRV